MELLSKGLDKGLGAVAKGTEIAGEAKDAIDEKKEEAGEKGELTPEQIAQAKRVKEEAERKKNPLKKGDYVVQVHMIECRDLGEVDKTFDPVCSATVMGKKLNSSIPEKATRSSWFDEVKVFQFAEVGVDELEKAKISIAVSDSRMARSNLLLGCLELDLSFVYYQERHELYRRWCALSNPTDPTKPGITGYMKLSVTVLGPGDEQYVHSAEDEEDDGDMNAVLMPPNVDQIKRNLRVRVWRAEHLPVTDFGFTGGSCDPYVKVCFGGAKDKTKHLKNTRSGDFNEELSLTVAEPVMAKHVVVNVLDWDAASKDDQIAAFTIDYAPLKKPNFGGPKWYNLYGASDVDGGKVLKKMNLNLIEGVAYRGRVLLEAMVEEQQDQDPDVDMGQLVMPPVAEYTVQFDLYEGSELPVSLTKETFKIELEIGSNLFRSHKQDCNEKGAKGNGKWYEVSEQLMTLPADVAQCPDVFIYLVSKNKLGKFVRRIAYFRMTFADLLKNNGWNAGPTWVDFRECLDIDALDDDEFPGSVLVALRGGLTSTKPLTLAPHCRPYAGSLVKPLLSVGASSANLLSQGSSSNLLETKAPPPPSTTAAPPPPTQPAPISAVTVAPPAPRELSRVGNLIVTVVSAKNLPGLDKPSNPFKKGQATSDPYVELSIDGNLKKTKVKDKELNPTWNETFEFKDVSFAKAKSLKVEVLDEDKMSKDETMGSTSYTLESLLNKANGGVFTNGKPTRDSAGREAQSWTYQSEAPFSSQYPTALINLRFEFQLLYAGVEAEASQAKAEAEKPKKSLSAMLSSVADKVQEGASKVVNKATDVAKSAAGAVGGPGIQILGQPVLREYEFRAHFYLARNLPAADASGRSDPFVVVRCAGQKITSKIKRDTLNPQWFESHQTTLRLPQPLNMAPHIQIALFDWDRGSRNDPLGRLTVKASTIENAPLLPTVYDVESWQGEVLPNVKLMACFQLLDESQRRSPMPNIRPEMKPMYVDVVTLGLRNLTSILGVHKTLLSFELPGERSKVFKGAPSNQPSAKDPNFLQVLKIPVELPVKYQFLPQVQLEVRDLMFGGIVNRLLGSCNVDLINYAIVDQKTETWVAKPPRQQESVAGIDRQIREEKVEAKTAQVMAQIARDEAKRESEAKEGKGGEKEALYSGMSSDSPEPIPSGAPPPDMKVIEESAPLKEAEKDSVLDFGDAKEPTVTFHAGEVKEEKEVEEVPFYLKGRPEMKNELEEEMDVKCFDTFPITTGSIGRNNQHSVRKVGTFKGLIRVSGEGEDASMGVDLEELLNPKDVFVRLYVLYGAVVPKDADGTSDPYLIVKLGKHKISTRERKIRSTLAPDFYESFEFATSLPGASQLEITVMDWDGIGDDLIGKTTIDLEDRWFSKGWRMMEKKPLERRSLRSPDSQCEQGHIKLWMEIMTPDQAKLSPMIDIRPPPPELFELRVIVWGVRDVPNMDEVTNQNDLYVTCALAAPRTKNKKLKSDIHFRAKNGTGNFNWRFIFPVTLPSKQFPRLKFAVWDMDFFSANDCIGEVVLNIRDLCKAAVKNKQEPVKFNAKTLPPPPTRYAPQWVVNIGDKFSRKKNVPPPPEEKPSDRFWLYLPERKGKVGRIEVSIELMHKDAAALLPAGTGRSAPNANPFLPEPEGRLNLSLFHPCNMIREVLGDRCTGKMVSCCCCILLITLCVVMFPMIFSNVIGNVFTPKFGN